MSEQNNSSRGMAPLARGGAALAKLGALAAGAGADIVRAELAEVGSQLVG